MQGIAAVLCLGCVGVGLDADEDTVATFQNERADYRGLYQFILPEEVTVLCNEPPSTNDVPFEPSCDGADLTYGYALRLAVRGELQQRGYVENPSRFDFAVFLGIAGESHWETQRPVYCHDDYGFCYSPNQSSPAFQALPQDSYLVELVDVRGESPTRDETLWTAVITVKERANDNDFTGALRELIGAAFNQSPYLGSVTP